MTRRIEERLRPAVTRHLQEQGFAVRHEVAFNGRVADVVAVRDGEVVAVELKLDDWRTALTQARAYQVGAPRAFVALPADRAATVAEDRIDAFEADGVGLLAVEPPDRVDVVADARPSDRTLPFLAAALRQGRVDG